MIFLDAEEAGRLAHLSGFDERFARGNALPIAIFDFDGVLCAPVEDQAYKLPEESGERERLHKASSEFGIDPESYDVPYLRHLLLQARLAEAGALPEPGPLLPLARELSKRRRSFYVLTARSGRAAIDRALAFMDRERVTPQEIFFVGRVAKGRQLALVRETIAAPVPLVYFDDSARHSKNSREQSVSGLTTVRVDVPATAIEAARAMVDRFLNPGVATNSIKHAA